MKFECSRNENECDKGIKWIDSCRECIFNVLCKLDKNWQTLFFNRNKRWGNWLTSTDQTV